MQTYSAIGFHIQKELGSKPLGIIFFPKNLHTTASSTNFLDNTNYICLPDTWYLELGKKVDISLAFKKLLAWSKISFFFFKESL